jgi:P3 major capsid protein
MAQAAPAYSAQQNMAARSAIISSAREMWQITNTNTIAAPIVGIQQNIALRNVGMCKRLLLEVTGTVAATGAETQNLTRWGLANIFSQVIVTDLANYNRIQTTGAHLYSLATLRRQMAYGAAFLNDAPVNMASNVQVNNGAALVNAGSGAKSFRMFFELPLAYSDTDLRGAIYSAVVNATWQVSYTVNPNFFVATGADAQNAVYQSSTAVLGTLSNVVVKTHQIYLDQLPFAQNGQPILPYYDLATGYLIQNSSITNTPAVTQDFPIQYPNFRSILSAFLQIDNGGVQNPGTDINYIGIQAANLVYLLQVDANTIALRTRNSISDDYPSGAYMLETRMSPINTTAYGNMQIVLNMSAVNAPFNVGIGWEMMAIINSVAGASSLPAG